MADPRAHLQLHLEPQEPIEVYELTAALASLARQYNVFVDEQKYFEKTGDGRLLISSVSPGSIDINFLPDLSTAVALATPIISDLKVVTDFGGHIKTLLGKFFPAKDADTPEISVRDCDDAINIVKPIAEHGGNQTFNTFQGPVHQTILHLDKSQAREIIEDASRHKARLQFPQAERKQRVSMVWNRLDKSAAKTSGSSPDKGTIEELDPKPRTILFTDELSYLKREMIADEANPLQKVYFVDVEVSRVADKITAYRIVGFHGKDELDAPPSLEQLL